MAGFEGSRTGLILAKAGSATAPSIAALGDRNTGLFWPAANTLAVTTDGVDRARFTTAAFQPSTSDGYALGTAAAMWSDLFLASGGVINWNNGDITITEAADQLQFALATSYSFDNNIVTSIASFSLINTNATTVNFAGAATTIAIGAAASVTTWTGRSISLTGANSTNNTTLTVENTSNAAAAAHAILNISVGGTPSTGDAQVRWTIPGGTSWYMGSDNSDSDNLKIGQGTTVGSSVVAHFTLQTMRLSGGNSPTAPGVAILNISYTSYSDNNGAAIVINNEAAVEAAGTRMVVIHAVDNDFASMLDVTSGSVIATPTTTILRVTPAGNVLINAATVGTNGVGVLGIKNGTVPSSSPVDEFQLYSEDIAAGDARLVIRTESGSVIYIGNDRLRFAAATGIIGIGATSVLSMTASVVSLVASGKIASASGVVGYSVVSTAYTLGSAGTVILPNGNMSGAADDAAREVIAGNLDGAIAIDTGVAGRVYARQGGLWKFALFT